MRGNNNLKKQNPNKIQNKQTNKQKQKKKKRKNPTNKKTHLIPNLASGSIDTDDSY